VSSLEENEMRVMRSRKRKIGILFTLALGMMFIFAYWMGAFGLGARGALFVTYNFAGGIEVGSPVRLGGIKVGRVRDIQFAGANGEVLRLEIEIRKDVLPQLTEDAQIYVNLAGLIGERYLEVVPGTGKRIASKHTFRGVDPPRIDQIFSQGLGVFGDLRRFYQDNKGDIRGMLTTMNDLTKNLNRLFSSSNPEERQHISTILRNVSSITDDVRDTMTLVRRGATSKDWELVSSLLTKANTIHVNDIRRLMLEDGVKINLSSKKFVELKDDVNRDVKKEAK